MTIIMLLWWSLARDNPVVPSSWQATAVAHLLVVTSTDARRTGTRPHTA